MSEYSFTYRNDSFSLAKAHDSVLYIKAGKTEFSLLIAEEGRVLAWKDKCSLTDLAEDEALGDILTAPFNKVVVGLIPDALTLVPSELVSDETTPAYARYLDVKAEDRVFAAKLDNENQIIYKLDHSVSDALAVRFNLQNTVPAYRGWLGIIAKNDPANTSIFIDVCCDQVTMANFSEGKVRFFNSFKISDVNDILYYALFVANQLAIEPDYASLIVSGNFSASDFQKLNEFFRIVKYSDLKVTDVPMGVPSHQVLSLAALA
ncbi:DUF3822 family protein [Mucilaginibacter boryungensis]|uniref:DUF3822 family protein n=1 Tax=Mucilaginibacter boryungensis TaxID=768480 RepID=A0ABR9XFX2_9SPHI|nr:DUF3822 family protein [Mucilaginibacter boryungensis]MBE9666090.1 DUF3822 family protein [Mucilaginibacter boryungensis]